LRLLRDRGESDPFEGPRLEPEPDLARDDLDGRTVANELGGMRLRHRRERHRARRHLSAEIEQAEDMMLARRAPEGEHRGIPQVDGVEPVGGEDGGVGVPYPQEMLHPSQQ
jgi:hypothetical protein